MPRILLVGRDPIRGLIDTAGADQGPRQRSKLLRVRRIARHGRGSLSPIVGQSGKRSPEGRCPSVRCASGSPVRTPSWFRLSTCGRPPPPLKIGRRAGGLFEKSPRPMISGFPVSEVSGFPNCPISR